MKKRRKWIALAVMMFALLMSADVYAANVTFTANPQTEYARQFIAKCEGQQWLLDETERLLNGEQKTINTITGAGDLDNIISLGFANRKISGHIPAAIGEFHNLRALYLSGNALSGTIPPELFTLTQLSNVDLSKNQYSGAIPAGFGTMKALTILQLKENDFSGTIPDAILSNTKLTFLDVSGNQLTGEVPTGLNRMTGLNYLEISDNPWKIGPMPDLSALTKLKVLSAWSCNFTGSIPDCIYTFTDLQILDLAENSLQGELSPAIGNLTELQALSIGKNQIEGIVPTEIENLTKLETLDIYENKLRGKLPEGVADVPKIYAQDNYMTGEVLKNIAHNERNFCDGAVTEQYQLISGSPVGISKTGKTNLYRYLKNKHLVTGDTTQKPLLSASSYVAEVCNDPDGKITLTADADGIYAQAADTVKTSENITVVIRIRDNDGSDYSKTEFVLTTETTSGGGGGGGGGGEVVVTPAPTPAPVATETHLPYIRGYADGTFAADQSITREEIAAMLTRALSYDLTTPEKNPFPDVAVERWSAANIAAAKKKGIVQGYEDGSFRPANNMTRAELAATLVRIAEARNVIQKQTTVRFGDVSDTAWYAEEVTRASAYGLITGYTDGTFRPEQTVTRAEAVTMINRMLTRNPETAAALKTIACPFTDIQETDWAYLQIMEAAVKHEH